MPPAGQPPASAEPKISPCLVKIGADTLLWRVHSIHRLATSFKDEPTDEVFGGGRFDATPADPYSFLYAAPMPETAILETITRDLPFRTTHFRTIRRANVKNLTLSPVLITEPLTLISLISTIDLASALQDEWLIQCESRDYSQTRRWAKWLRMQVPTAQGIVWMSRRDLGNRSMVLFGDRCRRVLAPGTEPAINLASRAGADWLNQRMKPYRIRIMPPSTS